MLALSLIWIAAGALVGVVAVAARLTPPRWQRRRWLALPALGAASALIGGWLSTLLFDHLLASCFAVWLCISAVGVVWARARWQVKR